MSKSRRAVLIALVIVAAVLDSVFVLASDDARFVERDGVLYVSNVPDVSRSASSAGLTGGNDVDYAPLIDEMAERYQVPATLIGAVIRAESNFNARAISPKGARGLMQLMPATAARLGVRDVFDPRDNIEGGVRYLRDLIAQFAGDLRLALAAYNAGPEPVSRLRDVPPYPETQTYVARVLKFFEGPAVLAVERGAREVGSTVRAGVSAVARYVATDATIVYTNVPVQSLPLVTRDRLARAVRSDSPVTMARTQ